MMTYRPKPVSTTIYPIGNPAVAYELRVGKTSPNDWSVLAPPHGECVGTGQEIDKRTAYVAAREAAERHYAATQLPIVPWIVELHVKGVCGTSVAYAQTPYEAAKSTGQTGVLELIDINTSLDNCPVYHYAPNPTSPDHCWISVRPKGDDNDR